MSQAMHDALNPERAPLPPGVETLPPGYKATWVEGKPRLALLPGFGALRLVGQVATYGAKRYSLHNWRGAESDEHYLDALLRHVFAYLDGEDDDPESKLPHLAHAAWNAIAVLQFRLDGRCKDSRYKKEVSE